MQTNFSFLKNRPDWADIERTALEAEKHCFTAPITSAFYARQCLELMVYWVFDNDSYTQPYQRSLNACIKESTFKYDIPPNLYEAIEYVRKKGNDAVHGKKMSAQVALQVLSFLHQYTQYNAKAYGENDFAFKVLNEDFIPKEGNGVKSKKELETLQAKFDALEKEKTELEKKQLESEAYRAKLEQQQQEFKVQKQTRNLETPPLPFSEAETRKIFIDQYLREAGWNPEAVNCSEYKIEGMPISVNPSGFGYIDYVLWNDDGTALALVEAKKTTRGLESGKTQAQLYADCLEKETGVRPIIFLSNGYETYILDDVFYSSYRSIMGFYTKRELKAEISRRKTRKDIRKALIDKNICNRYYQDAAIKKIAESFTTDHYGKLRGAKRKALLVMATGTGKTRTAAALTKVLSENNWVKRVLFLADRKMLVKQAKDSFKEHLPEYTSVNLVEEKDNLNTRLVFSTYGTILNQIDDKRGKEEKYFGPGYFDLIIIDEAHRSIYQKYQAIFNYFDALQVGLTATPRSETDRQTYEHFDCQDEVPTYYYELEQGVKDKHLTPGVKQEVDLNFPTRGIVYADLSDADKKKYEEMFAMEEVIPDEINASAINSWLFNKDTVRKVLDFFMVNGYKIDGGDVIGKTIIFARNHPHAMLIEEIFKENYPKYPADFIKVIDNYDKYAQDSIAKFKVQNSYPQIAVSVDMLDTGIDVPSIINLVFFKPVYTSSKFWQMIGRGTRLCPDLFGPGVDKENFLVFDFCKNFEFFDYNPKGKVSVIPKSLTQRIFEKQIEIAQMLSNKPYNTENQLIDFRIEVLDESAKKIAELWELRNTIRVRNALAYVDKFRHRANWDNLSENDIKDIFIHLAPIIEPSEDAEIIKRFDLLTYNYTYANMNADKELLKYVKNIQNIGLALQKKSNIAAVKNKLSLVNFMASGEFSEKLLLEDLRIEIRDLVKLLTKEARKTFVTDIEDEIIDVKEQSIIYQDANSLQNYKEKVRHFILKNKEQIVVNKLRNNKSISTEELAHLEKTLFTEVGGDESVLKNSLENLSLGLFIRSIVGLSIEAANEAFSGFIATSQLNSKQIEFINLIKEHLTIKGRIDQSMLYEIPFTSLSDDGIEGVFKDNHTKVFSILDNIDQNGMVG